jgi:hypothetical protein
MIDFRSACPILAATLALACAGAHAQANNPGNDDDAISPDRPDFVNSSKVVGKGRLQVEAGLQWERERDEEVHARTLTTPLTLRYGIGESFELRLETDGRTIVHGVDPDSGARADAAGYADSMLGFKWHIADQQGSVPSYGLIVEATVPSGSRSLRGQGVRPVVYLPAEWDLPNDFSVGIMPGFGADHNDAGARYGYGVMAVSVDKGFGERLHGFLEVAMPQIARADNGGTQAALDTGATWLVNKDCSVDAILAHGLNHRTPGLTLGFGVSFRL